MTITIEDVLNASTAIEAAEKFSEYIIQCFPNISEEDIDHLQAESENHPPHSKALILSKLLSEPNPNLFAWYIQTFGVPDPRLSYSGCPIEVYIANAGPVFVSEAVAQGFKFRNSPKVVGAWDLVVFWYSGNPTQEIIEATIAFLKTQDKPANFEDVADKKLSENDLNFFRGTRIPKEIYQQVSDMFNLLQIALSGDKQKLSDEFSVLRLQRQKELTVPQNEIPAFVQSMVENIVLYAKTHELNFLPLSALYSLGWVFDHPTLKSAQDKQKARESAQKREDEIGTVRRGPKPTEEGEGQSPTPASPPPPGLR